MEGINAEDIDNLDYNQLIGIVKETNRPPGGKNTVFEIINRLHLSKDSKILEIGTSTGFTPIEISRLVRCPITSIDINENSLAEAKDRAKNEGYDNIDFVKADVNNLPFDSESFNVVIVGNVFSLLSNKTKALDECMRVCKKDGFIVAIPMYYVKSPSDELIKKISDAIKVNITLLQKSDWANFFSVPGLETYWSKDFNFDYIANDIIEHFISEIMNRPNLKSMNADTVAKLGAKYGKYMFLFRDNLSHMGFTLFILSKKKIWEDPELYTSKEV